MYLRKVVDNSLGETVVADSQNLYRAQVYKQVPSKFSSLVLLRGAVISMLGNT